MTLSREQRIERERALEIAGKQATTEVNGILYLRYDRAVSAILDALDEARSELERVKAALDLAAGYLGHPTSFDELEDDDVVLLGEIRVRVADVKQIYAATLTPLDEARGELRIGDRVEVVGKYADEWRGEELYLAGVNAYGNGKGGLDYCVSPVWPPTPDCGLTDGFGRGEIKRITPPTGDKS